MSGARVGSAICGRLRPQRAWPVRRGSGTALESRAGLWSGHLFPRASSCSVCELCVGDGRVCRYVQGRCESRRMGWGEGKGLDPGNSMCECEGSEAELWGVQPGLGVRAGAEPSSSQRVQHHLGTSKGFLPDLTC